MGRGLQFYSLIAAVMCSAVLISCGRSDDDAAEPDPYVKELPPITNKPINVPTSKNCPAGTKLSYTNFGAAFLSTYCTSCHNSELTGSSRVGAPEGSDFETYKLAAVFLAQIKAKAGAGKTAMPPSGQVPADERKLLDEWIDCGAPEGEGID